MTMDSSIKNQKFTASNEKLKLIKTDSKKSSKCGKTGYLILAAIGILTAIVVVIGVGVGVGLGVQKSASMESGQSGLTLITITEWELEGEYFSSAGGIHFLSITNSSYFHLSITTTNGEPVIVITHPQDSYMTMMTVGDTSFMIMKNQSYVDYVIPKAYVHLIESAMELGEMPSEVFQLMDNSTVNETRQLVLENLAMSQEGLLIINATKALGDSEVHGADYRTAMRLYLLALQLAKISRNSTVEGLTNKRGFFSDLLLDIGELTGFCSPRNGYRGCERYPKKWKDNDCFGMCGPGCCCWKWVCKDCCAHQFCIDHDACCAESGFISLPCLAVVRDLPSIPCSEHYRYEC